MTACRVLRLEKDVWPGHANTFTLRLDKIALDMTRTPADLSGVTSMALEIEGFSLTVAALESGAGIDWWDAGLAMGEVVFQLGDWAESQSIPPGRYPATLVVSDPLNATGIVWISADSGELVLVVH